MDPLTLKAIGQFAGIGGIAVAFVTLVFRDIIRKKIFPNLTKEQGYRLLRLIAVLATILGLAGIGAWAYVSTGTADLDTQLRMRTDAALVVPQSDRGALSDLPQSGWQIFRLYPREKNQVLEAGGLRGGGAFYSFLRRTHEYGFGNEIGYENGSLRTGFAGLDYGYFLSVGDVPPEKMSTVTSDPPVWLAQPDVPGWAFLWSYKPPQDMKALRTEQREARGRIVETSTLSAGIPATERTSFLLRAISPERSDLLISLRLHRILDDGSLVMAGKILKSFSVVPIINRVE